MIREIEKIPDLDSGKLNIYIKTSFGAKKNVIMRNSKKVLQTLQKAREEKAKRLAKMKCITNDDSDDFEDIEIFAGDKMTCRSIPAPNIVGASLITGVGYTQMRRIFEFCNIKICAESTFYEAQQKILPIVNVEVDKTVVSARDLEKDYADLFATLDSRWSSRRNGSQNTASAISVRTGKVIAYKHTVKEGGRRNGDYQGTSNMMESAGLQAVAEEIKRSFPGKKVILTHDGDNKSKKIFSGVGIDAEHEYDINHGKGALQRAFTSFKKELLYAHGIKRPFHGIEQRLIAWAEWLFANIEDPEERVKYWLNSPNHLIGNHENCIHPDMSKRKPGRPRMEKGSENKKFYVWKRGLENPILLTYLNQYCELLSPYIRNASIHASTNPNESLNASISVTAPKRLALGTSYEARAGIAIGMKNDPLFFIPNLMKATGMTKNLSEEMFKRICKEYQERNEENKKRNSPRERKKANKKRKEVRLSYRSKKGELCGDYNENKEDVIIQDE